MSGVIGAGVPLSEAERSRYGWQLDVAGFGEEGQAKLRGSSVLISRVGGLGGSVAWQLAAAGVGKLVLAHAGNIKESDLNRQTLMTHDRLGTARLESAVARLKAFNPSMEIVPVFENATHENAMELVGGVDVVVDCAPLFSERFALNRAAVKLGKPMVEAAVNELEFHLTTIIPGVTPCLRCLYPENNPMWTRRFPVMGAVSGSVGSMAAMEAIKVLGGFAEPLRGVLLSADLRSMQFRRYQIRRVPSCPECGHL